MIWAIANELKLRKSEFENEIVETIYFGGGTPSVLQVADLKFLIETVYDHYSVIENPEITLEANPDDLTEERIIELSHSKINRLSIGIQSFLEDDLKLMNRAHNSVEAQKCLTIATKYFDNISLDLIFGIPGMTNETWRKNIEIALSFGISHISSYALTVEPKTVFKKLIKTGKIEKPDDDAAQEQFSILVKLLTANDYIHYEVSSFGKKNYFSKNNSAYWLGKKYLGIGPSAHSYSGISRSWNVSNNSLYIKSLQENKLPNQEEILTVSNRYNEYVMTGLRTIWGVSLEKIEKDFGNIYTHYLLKQVQKYLNDDLVVLENKVLKTSERGKFLTDGIASDLFYLNLE